MRKDLDNSILKMFQTERRRLTYTEIKTKLPNPAPDDKQLRRSLRRLWKQGKLLRLDGYYQWGRHSVYELPPPWSDFNTKEIRLLEILFANLRSYMADCAQDKLKEVTPSSFANRTLSSFKEVLASFFMCLEKGDIDVFTTCLCQTCVDRITSSPYELKPEELAIIDSIRKSSTHDRMIVEIPDSSDHS